MSRDDPAPRILAACAPGRRAAAEVMLAARGEHYDELIESPALEGTMGVVVMQENHWQELTRPVELAPSPNLMDERWRNYLLSMSVLQPSSIVVLGSV